MSEQKERDCAIKQCLTCGKYFFHLKTEKGVRCDQNGCATMVSVVNFVFK